MESEEQLKLEQLKKGIHDLSTELRQLGEEKEKKYKEKENIDKSLNSYIKTAKELRDKKVEIDRKVRELKAQREILNKELKAMFAKLAEAKKNLMPVDKKKGPRASSGQLKKQIDAMQYAIETEGLSFEREQTYMDKIKRMKVKLDEIEKEGAGFRDFKLLKDEINKKKTAADAVHAEIQKLAVESSSIFKDLSLKSEGISKAKQEKLALQEGLKGRKSEIETLNQQLSDTLNEWSKVSKETAPAAMSRKPEDVMGKLKSKKKLTKEDILIMQRSMGRN
jgi:uncharacterized coiled-coil DUF342 family protein